MDDDDDHDDALGEFSAELFYSRHKFEFGETRGSSGQSRSEYEIANFI